MGKALLIPVMYARRYYPAGITPRIQEIAGHFDISAIEPRMPYSLHTEYCFTGRRLDSRIIQKFPKICSAQKDGIPQLWFDKQWSLEFCNFIIALVGDHDPPKIIEIHPPFDDYCPSAELLIVYRKEIFRP